MIRFLYWYWSSTMCTCMSCRMKSGPLSVCVLNSSLPLAASGGVTTAHQVPAVSQSVYSPPTPDTPDSLLSTPPQTLLAKSLPPTISSPALLGPPPTQPVAKVPPWPQRSLRPAERACAASIVWTLGTAHLSARCSIRLCLGCCSTYPCCCGSKRYWTTAHVTFLKTAKWYTALPVPLAFSFDRRNWLYVLIVRGFLQSLLCVAP